MLTQKPISKTAIIDFDGTLCKFMFPDVGPVELHVKEALEILKQSGYTIKIHSCRTATFWGNEDKREQHINIIRKFMKDNQLPYDELIIDRSMDKPIADVYIDDRAIKYSQNWLEIAKFLKGV